MTSSFILGDVRVEIKTSPILLKFCFGCKYGNDLRLTINNYDLAEKLQFPTDLSKIKGSIEPTHGSACSDVRKLQSMDVPKVSNSLSF